MQVMAHGRSWFASALFVAAAMVLHPGLWFAPAAISHQKPEQPRSPLSPPQALASFRVASGLRMELVASEPEIESPVAMAFDEDGRLWVVEMPDYPNGPLPGKPPEGRIRVLEDRDGDGRFEHSTVFADRLLFANGLMPWRGGSIVTAAPNILYLSDTDGDGKADRREVLFEGFAAGNPQLRVSHPILGVDNRVYVANGLRGGQVQRMGRADLKPINLSGMDFAFDPLDPNACEAVSGMGQYGNTFDDWGQRFVCDNRHHIRHIVLEDRYIKRNPYLAVPAVLEDVSDSELGPAGAGAKVYPLSNNWTTSNLHAGRFTSACSVFIYCGNVLPAEYRGAAFTCEPAGNLVHQEILRPNGATFRSRPPRDGVEFLASPDDWCRPVFLADGPDGALYVVDMYRAVIEHPEFMPPELKNRPDLTAGKDKGRIWRIVPENEHPKPLRPQLSKARPEELVKLLDHPNAWWRTTAQRLLLERQDQSTVELLRNLVCTSPEPLARLHGAWLLHRFRALDEAIVLRLLKDDHPRVREQALRLSEGLLAKSKSIQDRVEELAADPNSRVRFQAALTLGEWDDDRIVQPLARIAITDVEDHWCRLAVETSIPQRAGALIATLLQPAHDLTAQATSSRLELLHELAALVGARREKDEVSRVLEALLLLRRKEATRWQMVGLNGLAEGMGRRGTQLSQFLASLIEGTTEATTAGSLQERIGTLLTQSAGIAEDANREQEERVEAIHLLANASWATGRPVLTRLMKGDETQEVKLAAVRALAAHPHPDVASLLMESWKSDTPAVRREVLEAMLQQPDRIRHLLAEVEKGQVQPVDLDAARIHQLLSHPQADIRDRARKLFQVEPPQERKHVLERYRAALTGKGDPDRGREVFKKNCATCHRIDGIGSMVGPDISDTRTKTAEQLLLDILNPNAAIDNNYINYLVTTRRGKVLTGILAAETGSSITLRRAENQTDILLRQDIEEIQSTGKSLMPEGLEKNITVQDMADLLTFLKNWRYRDGKIPLGGEAGSQKKWKPTIH